MNYQAILSRIRDKQGEIADRCKARIVGIFGSYARDEQKTDSDLDVLYEPLRRDEFSFTELNDLDEYLQKLTKASRIDLVDVKFINPVIELEIQDDIRYV